jgi:hypothetical protein
MRCKWAIHLLILLLFSAQVDDVWAASPCRQNNLTDENNEYLTVQRQAAGRSLSSGKQAPDTLGCLDADFSLPALSPDSEPPNRIFAGPFCPPPLYVFMSLRR